MALLIPRLMVRADERRARRFGPQPRLSLLLAGVLALNAIWNVVLGVHIHMGLMIMVIAGLVWAWIIYLSLWMYGRDRERQRNGQSRTVTRANR